MIFVQTNIRTYGIVQTVKLEIKPDRIRRAASKAVMALRFFNINPFPLSHLRPFHLLPLSPFARRSHLMRGSAIRNMVTVWIFEKTHEQNDQSLDPH
jgi:hypothetical protein